MTSIALDPPAPEPTRREGFFAYHGIWAPGVRLFRNLRFTAKAVIISAAFLLPMLALVAWQWQAQMERSMRAHLDATREHVEVVQGLLQWAQGLEASGSVTREQAQALAVDAIRGLRYSGSEYFWINDMQPRMVMHPTKPELNGKAMSGIKDPNGFALFDAFVAKVRSEGRGFVAYQWPRPGSEQPVDKVSYVSGFQPWGWIVGSGVYVDDVRAAAHRTALVVGGIVLLAMAVAAYFFLSFFKVIDGGLRETRRHMRAITEGDLTTSPSPWGQDEAAQLMLEMRRMQEALRGMVTGVKDSSAAIVRSSAEIAAGAEDLSSRTEQTAANLEQTAASMEQIGATVRSTSEHAGTASQAATQNVRLAGEGGTVMQQMVQTMEAIRASSAKIGDIIGVIDGIAFQTNILALNAAVEAARAGEQGRGFAVVAGEVRALAQRSASAAREIKSLVGRSVEQVENGSAVVAEAERRMGEIAAESRKVDGLLGQIATGAREQSGGVSQIGQSVQELDRMTQQNAAMVEQTAAAAASMKGQAETLAALVARFRLPR